MKRKRSAFRMSIWRSSRKLLAFLALVSAVCFVSTAAWAIADYPIVVPDAFGDCVTPQYPFGNGFDLDGSTGIASEASDTVTVTITINGIVGNGNQTNGITTITDGAFCSDSDPMVGCGSGVSLGNYDAPDLRDATTESYSVEIIQGASIGKVVFFPAVGTPNVQVDSGSVTVSPNYIAPSNTAQTFTLTIGNLAASGLDFTTPWTMEIYANALHDGPGEDLARALIEPPQVNPGITCTKGFDKNLVEPGDEITATVVITNTGDVATSVNVVDVLDAGLTYKETVAGYPVPVEAPAQTLTWASLGPLAPGASLTLKYVITVGAIAEGDTWCNGVTATSIEYPLIATNCQDCVSLVPKAPIFTQWGMIGFLLVLGAIAVCFMRRRRSVS